MDGMDNTDIGQFEGRQWSLRVGDEADEAQRHSQGGVSATSKMEGKKRGMQLGLKWPQPSTAAVSGDRHLQEGVRPE
jgi:hypothetical protein